MLFFQNILTNPRISQYSIPVASIICLDLLQVDLLASEAKPCLATKQPTASNEVARARLVSLDGFPFTFHAKNGDWRDSHLGFQVSFASP